MRPRTYRTLAAGLALVTVGATAVAALPERAPSRLDAPAGSVAPAGLLSPRRVPSLLSEAVADARLHQRLNAFAATTGNASCVVVGAGSRRILERQPDTPLIPASTLKVATATAATEVLGVDTRFTTTAVTSASPGPGGVVDGDLWIVGGGDPLLATAPYAAGLRYQPQVFTDITTLADAIVAAGVREVRGRVVGDGSRYDDVRYVPTWRAGYAQSGDVGPLGALVINDGFRQWHPRRDPAPDPALHAAEVITALLRERGVPVGAAAVGRVPTRHHEVAAIDSPPIRSVVAQMLRESDNNTAELLAKELAVHAGRPGATSEGVGVVAEALRGAGIDTEAVVLVDGSGLDRGNRLTCTALMTLLESRAGPVIEPGLAVANATGTLFDRFVGHPAAGRLRAKTGGLDGVVGLAGYVDPLVGPRLTFAFIANELPAPTEPRGRQLQEALGAVLATYPEAPTPTDLAP